MNEKIFTKNLILTPLGLKELQDACKNPLPYFEQQRMEQMIESIKKDPQNALWNTLWQISKKSSNESIGQLQFTKLPSDGRVEVNCALVPLKESDKLAAEALKGIAKWAFSQNKELNFVSTWLLDDDSPAAQILENAGFIETFESDGMVHFELERPHLSILAITMYLFILLSLIPGYFFGNFALWVTVGIFAGIFPGQFLENKVTQIRRKKASTPQTDQ